MLNLIARHRQLKGARSSPKHPAAVSGSLAEARWPCCGRIQPSPNPLDFTHIIASIVELSAREATSGAKELPRSAFGTGSQQQGQRWPGEQLYSWRSPPRRPRPSSPPSRPRRVPGGSGRGSRSPSASTSSVPVLKSSSELGYIEPTRPRGRRRVDGGETPRHRADALTGTRCVGRGHGENDIRRPHRPRTKRKTRPTAFLARDASRRNLLGATSRRRRCWKASPTRSSRRSRRSAS